MKIMILLLTVVFFSISSAADRYPLQNLRQQQQFKTLTNELRCLVCQNETLAASTAPLAADLRKQVYEMVLAGRTNHEITDYLVARYGEFVLFKPRFIGQTVVLWTAPFLLLLMALLILIVVIRRHYQRG